MQNNFDLKKFLIENKITTNSQKLDEFYYFGDTNPELQRAKNKPQDVLSKRNPGQVASGDKEDYKDVVKKKGKLGKYYGNKGPKGPLPEGDGTKIPFFHRTEVLKPFAIDKPKADQMSDLRVGLVVLPKQSYRSDSDIRNAVGKIKQIDGDDVTVTRTADGKEEKRKVSDLIHIVNWSN